jgi:hypothetical protein
VYRTELITNKRDDEDDAIIEVDEEYHPDNSTAGGDGIPYSVPSSDEESQ